MTKNDILQLVIKYRGALPTSVPKSNGKPKERAAWLFGEIERYLVGGQITIALRLLGFAQALLVAAKVYTAEDVLAASAPPGPLPRSPGLRTVPCQMYLPFRCTSDRVHAFVFQRSYWVPELILCTYGAYLEMPPIDPDNLLGPYDIHLLYGVNHTKFDYVDHSYSVLLHPVRLCPYHADLSALVIIAELLTAAGWSMVPGDPDWQQRWSAHVEQMDKQARAYRKAVRKARRAGGPGPASGFMIDPSALTGGLTQLFGQGTPPEFEEVDDDDIDADEDDDEDDDDDEEND